MDETQTSTVFDRASVLRRLPEQVAEDAETQRIAEDRLSHLVTDSIAIAHYRQAVAVEKNLTGLVIDQVEQLAEALFWQGKCELASIVTGIPEKKAEFAEFADALKNIETPVCSCSPIMHRVAGSAKGQSVPNLREIQRIYVGSLAKEVKFIRCDNCKKLFAQAL